MIKVPYYIRRFAKLHNYINTTYIYSCHGRKLRGFEFLYVTGCIISITFPRTYSRPIPRYINHSGLVSITLYYIILIWFRDEKNAIDSHTHRIRGVFIGYVRFCERSLVQQMSLVSQSCAPQVIGRNNTCRKKQNRNAHEYNITCKWAPTHNDNNSTEVGEITRARNTYYLILY